MSYTTLEKQNRTCLYVQLTHFKKAFAESYILRNMDNLVRKIANISYKLCYLYYNCKVVTYAKESRSIFTFLSAPQRAVKIYDRGDTQQRRNSLRSIPTTKAESVNAKKSTNYGTLKS